MIKETIKDHKRIIFNGNGYDDAWIKEATEVRGLMNYHTTADCLPHLMDKKNVDMLLGLGVYTEPELRSRYEITLDNYCKAVLIEANTMVQMARTEISPAIQNYALAVAKSVKTKRAVDDSIKCAYESGLVRKLTDLVDEIAVKTDALEKAIIRLKGVDTVGEEADLIRDSILEKMSELRIPCDEAETLTAREYWPFPTYGDLLFGVR